MTLYQKIVSDKAEILKRYQDARQAAETQYDAAMSSPYSDSERFKLDMMNKRDQAIETARRMAQSKIQASRDDFRKFAYETCMPDYSQGRAHSPNTAFFDFLSRVELSPSEVEHYYKAAAVDKDVEQLRIIDDYCTRHGYTVEGRSRYKSPEQLIREHDAILDAMTAIINGNPADSVQAAVSMTAENRIQAYEDSLLNMDVEIYVHGSDPESTFAHAVRMSKAADVETIETEKQVADAFGLQDEVEHLDAYQAAKEHDQAEHDALTAAMQTAHDMVNRALGKV